MKTIFFFFANVFVCFHSFSQSIIFIDSINQSVILDVILLDESTGVNYFCDQEGTFYFDHSMIGNQLFATRIGYEDQYFKIQGDTKTQKVWMNPVKNLLDELVISANRWDHSAQEIPREIESISKDEIIKSNAQTTADVLSKNASVFIQKSQQAGGSPMIRGFATNRLIYVVDDVRMNTAIFRSGNIQNVISIDPFSIRKAEVMHGPGSVIYGSDALGGVMQFNLKQQDFSNNDQLKIQGETNLRYSSANNENTGHIELGIAKKKWSLFNSISSFNFGDLRMGSKDSEPYKKYKYVVRINGTDSIVNNANPLIQIPSSYHQLNGYHKLRFAVSRKLALDMSYLYSSTGAYPRYDRHLREKNGLPRYATWNYGPQKWNRLRLGMSSKSDGKLFDQAKLVLAKQYFEESRISRNLNSNTELHQIEMVDAYSINLDFRNHKIRNQQWHYGLEWVRNKVNSTAFNLNIINQNTDDALSRYPLSYWNSAGFYLDYNLEFNHRYYLNAGVRYNYYSLHSEFDTRFLNFPFQNIDLSNGALTENLGFSFLPDMNWKFSINLATGFRSPNVDDIGKVFDSAPGLVIVPNPDLKSENCRSIEFGLAYDNGKFDLSINPYYTYLKDAMVRRDFQFNGQDSIIYNGELSQVQALVNAAFARVLGVDFSLTYMLSTEFSLNGRYSYQYGREELDDGTEDYMRHAAPPFGRIGVEYQFHKTDFEIFSQFSAGKTFEKLPFEERAKTEIYPKDKYGNPYLPSWFIINVNARLKASDNIIIGLSVENILDQAYKTYSSGIAAAGRNLVLNATYIFNKN